MGTSNASGKGRPIVDLAPVRAAIEPILVSHGVVLVDVEWLRSTAHGGTTLRVTIERPGSDEVGGGVNLDDCAEVSRDVSQALDVEDLISAHYNLEVSSPGLDRPLKDLRDFRRFEGKLAKVKLTRPAPDGQRVLRGTVVSPPSAASSEAWVALSVDGRVIEVPYADVSAASLVFELATQPKGAKPGQFKAAARSKAAAAKAGRKSKPAKRTPSVGPSSGGSSGSPSKR